MNLWRRIQNGDKKAFDELFRCYYPELKAYGQNLSNDQTLLEEALQKLFVKIWMKRKELKEVQSIKNYLFRAFRNQVIDLLRSKNKFVLTDQFRPGDFPSPIWNEDQSDQQLIMNTEKVKLLLEQLPSQQREVLYLRYYNQLSFKEVAEVMDLSYQSVRNYSTKAIKFLIDHWEK